MVDFQRKAMNENIHKVPTPTINTSSDTKPDEEEEEEVDETSYHPKDQSEEWQV